MPDSTVVILKYISNPLYLIIATSGRDDRYGSVFKYYNIFHFYTACVRKGALFLKPFEQELGLSIGCNYQVCILKQAVKNGIFSSYSVREAQ